MSEAPKPPPEVAPAPPPPAHVAEAMKRGPEGGFQPGGSRLLVETVLGVLAVLALGALAFAFAGRLAAWFVPLVPVSVDRKLGEVSQIQLSTLPECPEAAREYVQSLAEPLLAAAGETPFPFQFRVVRDESVNAFALPGGFVTVNSGLLEAAETGEEVAGVLGHEIQHALLRHGTRRMLRQLGGSVVLGLLFGGTDLDSLSRLAGTLTSLSYDRAQESEADVRGVELLLSAGIDPRGLSTFFERLARESSDATPPELLSTHPDPGARAELTRRAGEGLRFKPLPPPPQGLCAAVSSSP